MGALGASLSSIPVVAVAPRYTQEQVDRAAAAVVLKATQAPDYEEVAKLIGEESERQAASDRRRAAIDGAFESRSQSLQDAANRKIATDGE